MTPKEKAKELVKKYSCLYHGIEENLLEIVVISDYAIESALIAVDLRLDGDFIFSSIEYGEDSLEYWQEVKQEIEKL